VSRGYPLLPSDPSDEALARDWTLSVVDIGEVRRCRGEDNRHRFAIQLCALRTLGRFADDIESVPVRVVNHVGAQLGLPATLFVKGPDRAATETDHAHRIRAHLGYTTFDTVAAATPGRSTKGNDAPLRRAWGARSAERRSQRPRVARGRANRPGPSPSTRHLGSIPRG
jgi:hypothetical protein